MGRGRSLLVIQLLLLLSLEYSQLGLDGIYIAGVNFILLVSLEHVFALEFGDELLFMCELLQLFCFPQKQSGLLLLVDLLTVEVLLPVLHLALLVLLVVEAELTQIVLFQWSFLAVGVGGDLLGADIALDLSFRVKLSVQVVHGGVVLVLVLAPFGVAQVVLLGLLQIVEAELPRIHVNGIPPGLVLISGLAAVGLLCLKVPLKIGLMLQSRLDFLQFGLLLLIRVRPGDVFQEVSDGFDVVLLGLVRAGLALPELFLNFFVGLRLVRLLVLKLLALAPVKLLSELFFLLLVLLLVHTNVLDGNRLGQVPDLGQPPLLLLQQLLVLDRIEFLPQLLVQRPLLQDLLYHLVGLRLVLGPIMRLLLQLLQVLLDLLVPLFKARLPLPFLPVLLLAVLSSVLLLEQLDLLLPNRFPFLSVANKPPHLIQPVLPAMHAIRLLV